MARHGPRQFKSRLTLPVNYKRTCFKHKQQPQTKRACGPLILNIVPLETDIQYPTVVLGNSQHKMLFRKIKRQKVIETASLFYLIQVGVACNIIPPLLGVNKGLGLVC